jgi:hypothetical protein
MRRTVTAKDIERFFQEYASACRHRGPLEEHLRGRKGGGEKGGEKGEKRRKGKGEKKEKRGQIYFPTGYTGICTHKSTNRSDPFSLYFSL